MKRNTLLLLLVCLQLAMCLRLQVTKQQRPEAPELLTDAGCTLIAFERPNTYTVSGCTASTVTRLGYTPLPGRDPLWTDAKLRQMARQGRQVTNTDTIHMRLTTSDTTTHQRLVGLFSFRCPHTPVVTTVSPTSVRVTRCPIPAADMIADLPEAVMSATLVQPIVLHNTHAGAIVKGPGTAFDGLGLTGAGQIIGVGDSGVDAGHCAFFDSVVVPYDTFSSTHRTFVTYDTSFGNTADGNGHGTHVVGTIVGSGASWAYPGIAPDAKVAFQDLGVGPTSELMLPSDLSQYYFPTAYNYGARIHSNSWGGSVLYSGSADRLYDAFTKEVDEASFIDKDLLIIFSAGNDGKDAGRYSIGPPAAAKNCLTVGATGSGEDSWYDLCCTQDLCPCSVYDDEDRSEESLAYFSSVGPTLDGRIKPDIVAPGYVVQSAKTGTSCSSTAKGGTSMSAPVVAGLAALIREWFAEQHLPNPSSALMRAAIIGGTQEMTGIVSNKNGNTAPLPPIPNFSVGWGRVSGGQTLGLSPSGSAVVLSDTDDHPAMGHGGHHSFTVPIDTAGPVTVTLVWTDVPGVPDSVYPIENDLDLIVTTDSEVCAGNWDCGATTMDYRDRVNTVEKVTLNAQPGTLTIHVIGADVPLPSQLYAVYVTAPLPVGHDLVMSMDSPTVSLDHARELSCDVGSGKATWDGATKECVCSGDRFGVSCGLTLAENTADSAGILHPLHTFHVVSLARVDLHVTGITTSSLDVAFGYDMFKAAGFYPLTFPEPNVDLIYSFSGNPTDDMDGMIVDLFRGERVDSITLPTSGHSEVHMTFVCRSFDAKLDLLIGMTEDDIEDITGGAGRGVVWGLGIAVVLLLLL